ncbi:hypothetical protein EVAR_16778_1 [Eumeta japonica]|uniref:Uncharacterized protein n=1 Tax=Eumeta variegata TaxID=151549 RepID=A0A4C1ULY4_EUMVA|nr:hypothetical protein EVAR_16778_1 [Eumeta japonica]
MTLKYCKIKTLEGDEITAKLLRVSGKPGTSWNEIGGKSEVLQMLFYSVKVQERSANGRTSLSLSLYGSREYKGVKQGLMLLCYVQFLLVSSLSLQPAYVYKYKVGKLLESRWSPPSMCTRNPRGFTSGLPISQACIGYLMEKEWGNGRGSAPSISSLTGRNTTTEAATSSSSRPPFVVPPTEADNASAIPSSVRRPARGVRGLSRALNGDC